MLILDDSRIFHSVLMFYFDALYFLFNINNTSKKKCYEENSKIFSGLKKLVIFILQQYTRVIITTGAQVLIKLLNYTNLTIVQKLHLKCREQLFYKNESKEKIHFIIRRIRKDNNYVQAVNSFKTKNGRLKPILQLSFYYGNGKFQEIFICNGKENSIMLSNGQLCFCKLIRV